MNTKLTLNLDKNIIKSAKEYAKNRKVSLSQLIENYLNSLTKKEDVSKALTALLDTMWSTAGTNDLSLAAIIGASLSPRGPKGRLISDKRGLFQSDFACLMKISSFI